MDFKTLLDSSEPDFATPNIYKGPPIGFAAKVIQHTSAEGNTTTTAVYGSLLAPRPIYFVNCEKEGCFECCASQRSVSSSSMGSVDTTITDDVSPKCTPKVDVKDMTGKAEKGDY